MPATRSSCGAMHVTSSSYGYRLLRIICQKPFRVFSRNIVQVLMYLLLRHACGFVFFVHVRQILKHISCEFLNSKLGIGRRKPVRCKLGSNINKVLGISAIFSNTSCDKNFIKKLSYNYLEQHMVIN